MYRVTTRLAGIAKKFACSYPIDNGYSLKRKMRGGVDEEIAREAERDA